MAKYVVLGPLRKDGVRYKPGSVVEINDPLIAEELLGYKTIGNYAETEDDVPVKHRKVAKS